MVECSQYFVVMSHLCRSPTWKSDGTGGAVRLVLGQLGEPCLQRQVERAGEQRKDCQHVCEPNAAQAAFQTDPLHDERHHVEIEVHVVGVVERRQEEAAPLARPVRLMDAHTCLRRKGVASMSRVSESHPLFLLGVTLSKINTFFKDLQLVHCYGYFYISPWQRLYFFQ